MEMYFLATSHAFYVWALVVENIVGFLVVEDAYLWYVDIECIFGFRVACEMKKYEGVGMFEDDVEVGVEDGFGMRRGWF